MTMLGRAHLRLGVVVLIWLATIGTAQAAPSIAEYASGITSGQPTGITPGPDGNLWFTERGGSGALARITPSGIVTEFTSGLSSSDQPTGITSGPDGNLWFTEQGNPGRIGRITPAGAITEFTSGLTNDLQPTGITAGPDGNLWFTESGGFGRIGRITTAGVITEFLTGLTQSSSPTGIVAGPDGNLWFTERTNGGRIGRITPSGVITEFSSALTNNAQPTGIVAGPDGNLWFTELANPGRIGRITPAGVITEFATGLTLNSQPLGITAGADGNLWFTEQATPGRIGRITTAGVITEFTSLPTTNAQPGGITAEPDGNVWFTEQASPGRIGRITLPPGLTTVSPSAVAYQSATLEGSTTPRSQATTYFFEYGPTTTYGTQTATSSAGSGSTPQAVSAPIAGLTPQSTYHFRVVAANASGTTAGADQSFTTAAPPPSVGSSAASGVDHQSATLQANVTANSLATTYYFEYGPTTTYGTQTATSSAGSGSTPQAVSAPIAGLTPQSTYHFRVVAANASGTTAGADQTFTTDVAPALPPPANPFVQPPLVEPVAPPALGRSVTVDVVSGTVLVRQAGSSGFVALDGTGASLPVGSSIDAGHGVLRLSAVLPGGRSQTGTFWGGLFRVGQNRRTGVTHLLVPKPRACAPRTAAGISQSFARRPRPPANRLWGSDSHGRFSTHGANSAATVRGTKWLTEERCDGTLTRVVSGRVLVRDLRTHRSVLVSAGHAYLARAHH
jgi:streptogramin lyase